jgi:ribonuclease E
MAAAQEGEQPEEMLPHDQEARPDQFPRQGEGEDEGERRRRRRGRRGGRRRRRGWEEARPGEQPAAEPRETPWAAEPEMREPRPQRMETPADWTPYPLIADEEPPMAEPSPAEPAAREVPAHAGNGGGAERDRLSSDIGAPAGEPRIAVPPTPVASQPEMTTELAPRGPKRKGWWQRIVE